MFQSAWIPHTLSARLLLIAIFVKMHISQKEQLMLQHLKLTYSLCLKPLYFFFKPNALAF